MVNYATSARNIAQLMLFKGTRFAKNHRKKIIFALALLVLSYGVKKITIGHMIKFAETYAKVMRLIALPQAPKLRLIAEYSHPQYSVPKAIYECMNRKQLQTKIEKRQNCLEQTKYEHLTGAVATLIIYNASPFYFLVQHKYSNDFLELNASTQFELVMYGVRKRFAEEMPNLLNKIKQLLYQDISQIDLNQICNIQDFTSMFQGLLDKVLDAKFDSSQQQHHTLIDKATAEAKNRFVSHYQYVAQQESRLSKLGGKIFRMAGSILSFGEWFPPANIQITDERLQLVKYAYVQPLKKAISEGSARVESGQGWPNQESKELFQLVSQELQFGLQSLNFSILLRAHANYNFKILCNRINQLMIMKQKFQMPVLVLVTSLHKILSQQFFKPNVLQLRDNYHDAEVNKAIELVSTSEEQQRQKQRLIIFAENEPVSEEEHILEQVYLKHSFQHLEKQFYLKLFHQRSGVVIRAKRDPIGQADEMEKLLSMMGNSEALNRAE